MRIWSDEHEVTGFTSNVSEHGLFVEAQTQVPIGTRVHVEIRDREGAPFLAEALVVRHKQVPPRLRSVTRPGMGLRLLPPTELLNPDAGPATATPTVVLPDDGPLRLDLSDLEALRSALEGEVSKGVLAAPDRGKEAVGSRVQIRVALPPPWSEVTWSGRVMQRLEASDPPLLVLQLDDPGLVTSLATEILDYEGGP